MSDEQIIQVSVTQITVETTRQAPAGIWEHWCEHEGCKRWGSLGFQSRYGVTWFCGEHREDGETMPLMGGGR